MEKDLHFRKFQIHPFPVFIFLAKVNLKYNIQLKTVPT